MRTIRYGLYALGLLLVISGYTILLTSSGARILVSTVDTLLEAKVSANIIRGSLYRGIEIRDLVFEDSGGRVSIDELILQWQVFGLLKGQLHLPYVTAINIQVIVADKSDNEATLPRDIWLPSLNIESLILDKLVVKNLNSEEVFRLDTLQFTLIDAGKKYVLQDVFIKNKRLAIHANGSVEFIRPFNTRIISQVVVMLDNKPGITADIQLNGHQKSLLAELVFHEKLKGRATVSIKNLLDNPAWHADLKLDKFNPRQFDSSLPDMTADIALLMQGDSSSLRGKGRTYIVHRTEKAVDSEEQEGAGQQRSVDSQLEFGIDYAGKDLLVELEKLQLVTEEGELGVTGHYNHGSQKMELDASWEQLVLQLPESAYRFNTRGSLAITGALDDYSFKTEIEVDGVPAIPPFRISAPGNGNLDGLSVEAAVINLLGGTLVSDMQASWKEQQAFQLSWNGDKINPGRQWSQWPGDLTTSGEFQVLSSAGAWNWELKRSSTSGSLRDAALSLSLAGKSSNSGAAAISARAMYAQASVELDEVVGKNLDLKWQIESTDLSKVHPQMQGSLQSHGELAGSPDKPAISAKINAADIHSPWGRSARTNADISVDLSSDALIKADISMQQLNYQDVNIAHLQLNLDGRNSLHQFALKTGLPGIELELDGEGGLRGGAWSGRVQSLLLNHEVYRKWQTANEFSLDYDQGSVRVQNLCLKHEMTSLCAEGHYEKPGGAWELKADAGPVPLLLWQDKLPETVVLDGHLSLATQLGGVGLKPVSGTARIEIPTGVVKLTVSDEVDNQLVLDQTYLDIKLDKGVMNGRGEVPNPGHGFNPLATRFQVTGISTAMPATEALLLNGELAGGVTDLSLLSALVPQLLELRGSAVLDVQVSGSVAEPVYDGSINLLEAAFSSSDLGIEVKSINFKGSKVSENRYEVVGNLRSGEGHLEVRAIAGQLDNKGPEFNITLDGDNFELVNLPELWALVRPNLTGKLSLARQIYAGRVLIPAATINLDEIAFASSLSEDEIVNNAEPEDRTGRLKRQLNVNVELGDAVQISGKGISGKLTGNLHILNNKQGLLIGDGEIAISNGLFTAYGQKLVIQEGRLIYNKSALDNPAMRIVATRDVEDFKVGVKIDGYTTAPQISLFSTSSLPQEQILSYIVFGRSLNSLSSREGSDLLGAATSMGLRNSGFITDKVAARFGLDQISLSGSTAESASLVIGKYINPKLYLSYGLGIFDKISTARLKYDLSKRFSLEAERGSETGVDLFYQLDR